MDRSRWGRCRCSLSSKFTARAPSLGFRFGPIAYSTDLVELPEASFAALEGVDTWIVAALARFEHPLHASLDQVLAWVDRLAPRVAPY